MTEEQIKKNLIYFLSTPALQAGYIMTHTHYWGEDTYEVWPLASANQGEHAYPNLFLLPVDFEHLDTDFDNLSDENKEYLRTFAKNCDRAIKTVNGDGWYIGKEYSFPSLGSEVYVRYGANLIEDLSLLKNDMRKRLLMKGRSQMKATIEQYLSYAEQLFKSEETLREIRSNQSWGNFKEFYQKATSESQKTM